MTYAIAHTAKGFQCYRLISGLYTLNVGPAFPDVKSAIRYSDALEAVEAADVSPLRDVRRETHADPSAPLPGSGQSGLTPEPLRSDSGPRGQVRE